MITAIQSLKRIFEQSQNILIFTGAGISTESGISDYRSKGGLWDRYKPVTIQEFLASEEKRIQYWKQKEELYKSLTNARPNPGHFALVQLEKQHQLKGIVTQNIDGLHQMAGNSADKILELHGTNRETICLSCGEITSWEETAARLDSGEKTPLCRSCQGFLKPNTISFGQNLNPQTLDDAVEWSRECDCFVVLGSTLVVEPAASLPRMAKAQGARLIILTQSETPLDGIADIKIEAGIGEVLQKVIS